MSVALLGVAFAAQPRSLRGSADKERELKERVDAVTHAVSDLSWFISEDGVVSLAGVTRFELDDDGFALIEAKRGGDVAFDLVLSLQLPVVIGPDGNPALAGLQSAGLRRDRVKIVVDLNAGALGTTASHTNCQMYKPINGDPDYCCCDYPQGCDVFDPDCNWVICPRDPQSVCCGCKDLPPAE